MRREILVLMFFIFAVSCVERHENPALEAQCNYDGAQHPKLCQTCKGNSDCGTGNNLCVDLPDQGSRCLTTCGDSSDCPDDFVCLPLMDDSCENDKDCPDGFECSRDMSHPETVVSALKNDQIPLCEDSKESGHCLVKDKNVRLQHCVPQTGPDIRITFLHTSDMHSRLLPYRMQVTYTDNSMGLKQENAPFGGIARVGHIINRERAKADRVVYVDTGDIFQGAPIFNVFHGEAEFRALSYINPDVFAIGNHEFDTGLGNLIKQAKKWISFPVVAANYYFQPDNELGDRIQPFILKNLGGVKVAFLGMGDFSSLSSLTDIGNSLKMMPINPEEVVNEYVSVLEPISDLVVMVSHAGLRHDQEIIKATCGIDVVFGGHLHIVLDPPKVVQNKCGEDVLLVHSGAFAKYVGRLDVVAKKDGTGRTRVMSHDYQLFPVDSTVPEEPKLAQMMQEYTLKLNKVLDTTSVYGYSPKLLTKYGYEGGDSSLGNLVSEAIRRFARVEIGFTNTLGIRANMYPGPITMDDLFNVFPFENSIVLMYMSGTDLRALFDYVSQRSSGRGCVGQLQVAGIEFTMNCNANPPPFYFDCWDDILLPCTEACAGGDFQQCQESCVKDDFTTCVLEGSIESNGGEWPRKEDELCISQCPFPAADIQTTGYLGVGVSKYRKAVNEAITRCQGESDQDFCLDLAGYQYCCDESSSPAFCQTAWPTEPVFEVYQQCLRDCFPRAEDIVVTDCPDPNATVDLSTCTKSPLIENNIYEVATNDYIAHGGSGFTVLKANNTQQDTELPLREAVLEVIVTSPSCLEYCKDRDDDLRLAECSVFQGCLEKVGAFNESFCEKVDKTTLHDKYTGTLKGCAVDTGGCYFDRHCYAPDIDCADGSCPLCETSAQCMVNEPNSICVEGRCMAWDYSCVEGRCQRRCEDNDDCPGEMAQGETQCAKGFCQPAPSISCLQNAECVNPYRVCYGQQPICQLDVDCEDGFQCRDKLCIPKRIECDGDNDCPAGLGCNFGLCTGPAVACTKDGDCGTDAQCKSGSCAVPCGGCLDDSHCPGTLSCVKNLCVSVLATCKDHRCRTYCAGGADCKSGETCSDGLCLPALCLQEIAPEEGCRLNAQWLTQETCINVPCVDSKVDGRIGRILPDNLGELEFGFIPNDPEDLDQY